MGLIKAAMGAVGGTLADQWIDFFSMDSLPADVLVAKGQRYTGGRGSNTKGSENIITNGSGIVVAEGQAAAIVDNGVIVEFSAEPGRYTYDQSSEPSIFGAGSFFDNLAEVFKAGLDRFKHGGGVSKDQRVYYFNTKEILGNKYGTPNPVPFRVVDANIGLDVDISIRCNGEFSYRLANPILFFQNIAGNVNPNYTRDQMDSQLKSEVLTALQPAFAKISVMGIRYSALPAHTVELSMALNEALSSQWQPRGLSIVNFGVNSVTASPEDEQLIKDLQRAAVLRDPNMAAATLASAQADAMRDAANNSAGAMTGFLGMGMAQGAGGANPAQLFQQGQAYPGGMPQNAYPVAPDGGFPSANQGAWAPPPAAAVPPQAPQAPQVPPMTPTQYPPAAPPQANPMPPVAPYGEQPPVANPASVEPIGVQPIEVPVVQEVDPATMQAPEVPAPEVPIVPDAVELPAETPTVVSPVDAVIDTVLAVPTTGYWACACGKPDNVGNFCSNCGAPRPA